MYSLLAFEGIGMDKNEELSKKVLDNELFNDNGRA